LVVRRFNQTISIAAIASVWIAPVVLDVAAMIVLLFRRVGAFVVYGPVPVVLEIELVRRVDELCEMVPLSSRS
jgi:hypothetical protein